MRKLLLLPLLLLCSQAVSQVNVLTVDSLRVKGIAFGDGTRLTSAGGVSVGGSNTQVQFNDGGALGGDAGFVFNKTTDALTLTGPMTAEDYFRWGDGTSNYFQLSVPALASDITITWPSTLDTGLKCWIINGTTGTSTFEDVAYVGNLDFNNTYSESDSLVTQDQLYDFALDEIGAITIPSSALNTSDKYVLKYFAYDHTITSVTAVWVGGTSPSGTIQLSYGSSLASATNVFSSAQTVTSQTTGNTFSSFSNSTPAASNFFWLTAPTLTTEGDYLHVTVWGRKR